MAQVPQPLSACSAYVLLRGILSGHAILLELRYTLERIGNVARIVKIPIQKDSQETTKAEATATGTKAKILQAK